MNQNPILTWKISISWRTLRLDMCHKSVDGPILPLKSSWIGFCCRSHTESKTDFQINLRVCQNLVHFNSMPSQLAHPLDAPLRSISKCSMKTIRSDVWKLFEFYSKEGRKEQKSVDDRTSAVAEQTWWALMVNLWMLIKLALITTTHNTKASILKTFLRNIVTSQRGQR